LAFGGYGLALAALALVVFGTIECPRKQVTFALGRLVVGFADELAVLHEVELVAGVELAGAEDAGEAVEVVDELLRAAHHLRGRDALAAAGALGPVPPAPTAAHKNNIMAKHTKACCCVSSRPISSST